MKKLLRVCIALFMLVGASSGISSANKEKLPARGVVPDEATAVKIADAVFLPVFGREEIDKDLPYYALLKGGVWTVYGTLKRNSLGGTPQLTIRKKDGKVIEIWHSQ